MVWKVREIVLFSHRHVDFAVILCEPKLVLILATRRLIVEHKFWWTILYILILVPQNISLLSVFELIKPTFGKRSR